MPLMTIRFWQNPETKVWSDRPHEGWQAEDFVTASRAEAAERLVKISQLDALIPLAEVIDHLEAKLARVREVLLRFKEAHEAMPLTGVPAKDQPWTKTRQEVIGLLAILDGEDE